MIKYDKNKAREIALPFSSYGSERREIARLLSEYSLARAIRRKAERKPLDGVELEMHEMIAQRSQVPTAGNICVPSVLTRTGTNGNFETTGVGSTFVPTGVAAAQGSARQRPLLEELGVRTLTSEGGTIQIPKYTAGTVKVKAEAADADSSAAATTTVTLSPQRATASTLVTQQLLTQGGADSVIDSIVAELQADVARIIDRTAFDLLVDSTDGITTNVEEATDGATQRPLTQDMLDDMLRAAHGEGADMRNMAYVGSPSALEDLQGIVTNNVYALDKVANVINGRPFYPTTDLVDHSGGTARLIVGDFAQGMVKADFGLLDVLVNVYDLDQSHQARITVHQYFDVQIMDESVFTIYREEV